MAKSWGHEIVRREDENVHYATWASKHCSGRRCPVLSEYVVRWKYVTGRAGRVTYAHRSYCREHAEKFVKKHGLELPPLPQEA